MSRGWTIGIVTAIAALFVLGSVGAIFGARAIVDDYEAHNAPADPGTREGNYDWQDVKVGDCAMEWDEDYDEPIWEVELVDCAKAHELEAYAIITLKGDKYPGDKKSALRSEAACKARFATYVGESYAESDLDYTMLYPATKDDWNFDRQVLCFLIVDQKGRVGSL